MITALETIAEDKLKWDYVRGRLIHEFDKMHGENSKIGNSDTRQDALLSSKSAEQKMADTRKFRCHYCKKKGHFVKDCSKRKADAKKSPHKESANRV